MAVEAQNVLSASDVSTLAKGLLLWLRTCPSIPSGVTMAYQYLAEDKDCMSLHTLSGAVKREEYVDGSYEGYYPFAVYFRSSPDSTNSRIDCNNTIDSIGEWIDEQDSSSYPDVEDIEINSIQQVTNSTLVKRFANGFEDYMAKFELLFERS